MKSPHFNFAVHGFQGETQVLTNGLLCASPTLFECGLTSKSVGYMCPFLTFYRTAFKFDVGIPKRIFIDPSMYI